MPGYLEADRICDLVMKGGITSGVVYPPAIDRIAKRFWLNGIGGASAGAIAAALAAAAEYRRRAGSEEGFELLRRIPGEISDSAQLFSLFKPDASTRKIFALAVSAMSGKGGKLRRGFSLGGKLLKLSFGSPLQAICDNNFGLCTGMALDNESKSDPLPPLTKWLDLKINEVAGLAEDRPLTFGDLWAAKPPPGLEEFFDSERSIQLQMVSTCVTFGRPYALPFLDHRFSFSPAQFRRLFPKRVVDYMVAEGQAIVAAKKQKPLPGDLLPLPVGAKFPVIVATRMSLSFPALFAMVPMHYMNYHDETPKPVQVWFSDGGLTSNLPIHFFDSPIPRWPTLAINLQYADKPGDYGRANVNQDGVWMTSGLGGGRLEVFHRFGESGSNLSRLFSVVMALFQSSQNWHDNSFLVLPGYGDRVAEIWLDPEEGGLNLAMPRAVIERLLRKGETAGRLLVERFADQVPGGPSYWEKHRWARYRSITAAVAAYLRAFAEGMQYPLPPDASLADVLKSAAQPGYPFDRDSASQAEAIRSACENATTELLAWVDRIDASSKALGIVSGNERPFVGGPRPFVELAARAPLIPPVS